MESKWSKFISLSGWFVGLISLVLSIWFYLETRSVGSITIAQSVYLAFDPPHGFDVQVSVNTVPIQIQNSKIEETIFTVWNSGNLTIRDVDLRTPLEIISGQSNRILDAKIVESKTAISENFVLQKEGSEKISIRWKIFDPDMAIKVAVLHTGSSDSLAISGNFGPGIKINNYTKSGKWAFFPGVIAGAIISLLATMIAKTTASNESATLWRSKTFVFSASLMVLFIIANVMFILFRPSFEAILFGRPPISVSR
jgi:hypothetical protein